MKRKSFGKSVRLLRVILFKIMQLLGNILFKFHASVTHYFVQIYAAVPRYFVQIYASVTRYLVQIYAWSLSRDILFKSMRLLRVTYFISVQLSYLFKWKWKLFELSHLFKWKWSRSENLCVCYVLLCSNLCVCHAIFCSNLCVCHAIFCSCICYALILNAFVISVNLLCRSKFFANCLSFMFPCIMSIRHVIFHNHGYPYSYSCPCRVSWLHPA